MKICYILSGISTFSALNFFAASSQDIQDVHARQYTNYS